MRDASMRLNPIVSACLLAALTPLAAHAQQSTEDRMRDALRQAVTEMRAAQDASAQAQADLAKANADKAALQTQLDAANAKLAETAGKPTIKPADQAALENRARTAEAAAAQYQALNAKLQSSYQSAAEQARAKDDETRAATAQATANATALETCKATNAKLIDVSEQILHLYESQSFRAVWLKSYEPFLGQAKVKLENMVQDYDDKIHDQEYVPKATRAR
jgi:chromosome segregation ATPase